MHELGLLTPQNHLSVSSSTHEAYFVVALRFGLHLPDILYPARVLAEDKILIILEPYIVKSDAAVLSPAQKAVFFQKLKAEDLGLFWIYFLTGEGFPLIPS